MKLGLHVIQNPNGTYHFVGNVPALLAYVSKDGQPLSDAYIAGQMRLPSSFRSIKTRVWATKEDAINEATRLGFEVTNE